MNAITNNHIIKLKNYENKNTIFITILISLGVNTYAQEPFDVNGYLIFEKNGEYYNIVGNDTLKVIPDLITVKFKEEATEQQITVRRKYI
jgi:hypothetical protein